MSVVFEIPIHIVEDSLIVNVLKSRGKKQTSEKTTASS